MIQKNSIYNECSYCITEALQIYWYITCIYKPIKLPLLIPVCICLCNYVAVFIELNELTEQNLSLHMRQCIVMYLYS